MRNICPIEKIVRAISLFLAFALTATQSLLAAGDAPATQAVSAQPDPPATQTASPAIVPAATAAATATTTPSTGTTVSSDQTAVFMGGQPVTAATTSSAGSTSSTSSNSTSLGAASPGNVHNEKELPEGFGEYPDWLNPSEIKTVEEEKNVKVTVGGKERKVDSYEVRIYRGKKGTILAIEIFANYEIPWYELAIGPFTTGKVPPQKQKVLIATISRDGTVTNYGSMTWNGSPARVRKADSKTVTLEYYRVP